LSIFTILFRGGNMCGIEWEGELGKNGQICQTFDSFDPILQVTKQVIRD
jgi:hypothetical protein